MNNKWVEHINDLHDENFEKIEQHYGVELSIDDQHSIINMFNIKCLLEESQNDEKYFVMMDILKQILKAPTPEMLTWNRKDEEDA